MTAKFLNRARVRYLKKSIGVIQGYSAVSYFSDASVQMPLF